LIWFSPRFFMVCFLSWCVAVCICLLTDV
jgi:hypothetical protein